MAFTIRHSISLSCSHSTGDRLSFSSLSIDFRVIAVKNFPMMSAPRVLILGHSFVRRLSSFLSNSAAYSSDLALADLANISLFGVGGRTVAKVEKFDLDHVRISKPDIVTYSSPSFRLLPVT